MKKDLFRALLKKFDGPDFYTFERSDLQPVIDAAFGLNRLIVAPVVDTYGYKVVTKNTRRRTEWSYATHQVVTISARNTTITGTRTLFQALLVLRVLEISPDVKSGSMLIAATTTGNNPQTVATVVTSTRELISNLRGMFDPMLNRCVSNLMFADTQLQGQVKDSELDVQSMSWVRNL